MRHRHMCAHGRPPRARRTGDRARLRPRSLLGTTFTGRLNDQTQIGPYPAVLPSLSGRGWITGYHTYVLAADDPFPRGYTIADLWGTEC